MITCSVARADNIFMLWSYLRGGDVFHVEATFDKTTHEFVLRFRMGDQNERIERFNDEIAFRARLETLDEELTAQSWGSSGPPVILKDGWKL